ncbi:hypothetical protein MFLO_02703 [Listeria floridensis FSL S10-1187]|uniref:Uncharacterized protein n=1 Tax=Listeria floridensis FSL S10-1187 TaxID=1265817 RepID=A0ABP3B0K5_9LIST|nr:hypothetical protein MFLO_02703 [Listeria floridensis FSL S10-1187]
MNWLHTNALFDSVTNADKFFHDFHKIVVSDVPLWAVQKDLLYLMEMNETKSFRIPSPRTRDRCNHIFYLKRQVSRQMVGTSMFTRIKIMCRKKLCV